MERIRGRIRIGRGNRIRIEDLTWRGALSLGVFACRRFEDTPDPTTQFQILKIGVLSTNDFYSACKVCVFFAQT